MGTETRYISLVQCRSVQFSGQSITAERCLSVGDIPTADEHGWTRKKEYRHPCSQARRNLNYPNKRREETKRRVETKRREETKRGEYQSIKEEEEKK